MRGYQKETPPNTHLISLCDKGYDLEELERIVQLAGQYGRTDEASMMVLAGYREAYKTPLEAPHTPEVVRNWKLDMNHSVCSSDSGADSPW